MSTVTVGVTTNQTEPAPLAERLSDALVLESMALHQRAARHLSTPEQHRDMADRLGAAMAQKKAAQRAAGGSRPGSGRPRNWYAVQDHVRPEPEPTQDLALVADYMGIAEASLKVYMARGGGRFAKNRETDIGTVEVWVRRATPAELAWLQERGDDAPLWQQPHNPNRKRPGAKAGGRASRFGASGTIAAIA